MNILFVCNNAYVKGNGLGTSVRNFKRIINNMNMGHEVRLLSSGHEDPDMEQPAYCLKKYKFPLFQPIIDANGFCYAERDYELIRKAVEWADVVHIMEPFPLQKSAIREAERQGKAIVGTFHIYTQNIIGEIPVISHIGKPINYIYMKLWISKYFNHCDDIICPTPTVKKLLEEFKCKARLHVITNGVDIDKEKVIAQEPQTNPYLIISVGRLSPNKNHGLILESMKYSRHAHEIQLHFAGKGQSEKKYRAQASDLVKKGILKYTPVFQFHTIPELKELASKAYLYIHSAKIEVEGLGCIESIREGTVPLIGKAELVATTDFALDERSIYPLDDPRALAEKIDWWIEHPQERNRMAQVYADNSRNYDINLSAEKMLKAYETAIKSKK